MAAFVLRDHVTAVSQYRCDTPILFQTEVASAQPQRMNTFSGSITAEENSGSDGEHSEGSDQAESSANNVTDSFSLSQCAARKPRLLYNLRGNSKMSVRVIRELVEFVVLHATSSTEPKDLRSVIYHLLTQRYGVTETYFGMPLPNNTRSATPPEWSDTFLVVGSETSSSRVIIDVDFRSKFFIARSTPKYRHYMNCIPIVTVEPLSQLKCKLNEITAAMSTCFAESGIQSPPWRSRKQLLAMYNRCARTPPVLDDKEKLSVAILQGAVEGTCPSLRNVLPTVNLAVVSKETYDFDKVRVDSSVSICDGSLERSALSEQLQSYFQLSKD